MNFELFKHIREAADEDPVFEAADPDPDKTFKAKEKTFPSRDEMIDALAQDDQETQIGFEKIKYGCRGYIKYSDDEIRDLYLERIDAFL